MGSIVALRGHDSNELWRFNTRSEVFLTVCNVDLNGDDELDCISAGRQATVLAFDPRKGEVSRRKKCFFSMNLNPFPHIEAF